MHPNPRQPLETAGLGPRGDVRRRSLPPPRTTTVRRSPQRRWRERPRCSAQPVTPGRRGGVVHAIGCLRRVSPDSCHVPSGRIAPVARADPRPRSCPEERARNGTVHDARADHMRPQDVRVSDHLHERTTIASTMLAPCSVWSMLSASLRPGPWPGLRALTTPARGSGRRIRDGGEWSPVPVSAEPCIRQRALGRRTSLRCCCTCCTLSR